MHVKIESVSSLSSNIWYLAVLTWAVNTPHYIELIQYTTYVLQNLHLKLSSFIDKCYFN